MIGKRRSADRTPTPGPGESYSAYFAVVEDRHSAGAIEEAQQFTHDQLRKQVGPYGVTGIWWTVDLGASGLRKYRGMMKDIELEPTEECVRRLSSPRGALVVAWVVARPPKPEQP